MLSDMSPIRHLEWENLPDPMIISQIHFERSAYTFDEDAVIEIKRSDEFKLKAKLRGSTDNVEVFQKNYFKGNSTIIEGDTIRGKDAHGNEVILHECYIDSFTSTNANRNKNGYYFESDILIDSCQINKSSLETTSNTPIRLEWFITARTKARLKGSTLRKGKPFYKKLREGIDIIPQEITDDHLAYTSWSHDYIKVDLPEGYFILSIVAKDFTPEWTQGICIEYYPVNTQDFTNQIKECITKCISFLLGSVLIPVGHSIVSGNETTEAYFQNPWQDNIKKYCSFAFPPVHFNYHYDWGNLQCLAQSMLGKYISLNEPLQLNQVIGRYFIALKTPIGVNLPILANALEILSTNYLKKEGKLNEHFITDEKYAELISPELEILSKNLSGLDGAENILRKIKGANRRNPAEKVLLFLQMIGIIPGKLEKQALALRNKMAHSVRDYSDDETSQNDVVMTRIYQTLFNRIVLKVLGYADFYIDYSQFNVVAKYIDLPAGKNDH